MGFSLSSLSLSLCRAAPLAQVGAAASPTLPKAARLRAQPPRPPRCHLGARFTARGGSRCEAT